MKLKGKTMANVIKVGVVTARFNSEVTEKLEEGALAYLESCPGVEVYAVRVPGAVEIPLTCQALLDAGCEGVVALGAVIRGETSHYDYVCQSVERGITELMLVYNRPIGFGILTTENEEQAMARAGGEHGNKGAEAAQVVMEMIGVLTQIANDVSPEAAPARRTSAKASAGKSASKASSSKASAKSTTSGKKKNKSKK
jgi:6,7-dimethyl-8-ribityllumazine synthase